MTDVHSDAAATYIEDADSDKKDSHISTVRRYDEWWHDNRDKPITEAGTFDVVKYLRWRDGNGCSQTTLATEKSHISTLYRHLQEFTDMDPNDNPALVSDDKFWTNKIDGYGSRTKKTDFADNDEGIVYLEPWEVRAVRENVPDPKIRNELMIKLMVQTGARRNEITSLKLDDVHRDEQKVELHDSKTDKRRTVPYDDLSPELGAWLDKYRAGFNGAGESEYVFLTHRSDQLSERRITKIIDQAAEEAGIQETMYEDSEGRERRRITAHAFRHTYAMRLVDAGLHIRKIKDLMGHSDISQTNTYLHVAEDEAAEAYQNADITFEAEQGS